MTFVNVKGEPIDLAKLRTPKRTKTVKPKEASHKGFAVFGVSREQVEQARAEHIKRVGQDGQPFDQEGWLRNAKATRLSKKPFATQAGADECRALAERQGWLRVRVEAVAKA